MQKQTLTLSVFAIIVMLCTIPGHSNAQGFNPYETKTQTKQRKNAELSEHNKKRNSLEPSFGGYAGPNDPYQQKGLDRPGYKSQYNNGYNNSNDPYGKRY